jgi:beta-lactamase regulating signal transducer with metallopeptidase domain
METIIGRFLAILGRNSVEAGVLVVVVLLAQWFFGKRIAPRWRCGLWMLVMARLLLPVSAGSVVSLFNLIPRSGSLQTAVASRPVPQEAKQSVVQKSLAVPAAELAPRINTGAPPEAAPNPNSATESPIPPLPVNSKTETKPVVSAAAPAKIPWPSILFATWLAGFAFFAGYMLTSSFRIRRQFARLEPVTDAGLLALLRDCRERLGVRGDLSLSESPDIVTPALYGFLKPKLLLPCGFIGRFSAKELRFILLHELAHVKRRDILFNWLAAILQILHWFNPLIWFGFARWRADRELACDALALEAAGAGQNQEYGQTILRLLENFKHRVAVPGLVGILEDKKQLQRRIRMIAGFRPSKGFGLVSAVLFAGLGVVCLTDAQNKAPVSAGKASSSATVQSVPQAEASSRPVVTNGPPMNVTVLDDATGLPLENVEVFAPNEASFFGRQENAPRWLTDKSGIATIRLGESPSNSVWQMTWFTLSARKEGYAPSGRSWSNGSKDVRLGLPKEITLRLKHGTIAGGVVADEAGVAQAGIQVRVFGSGYSYERFQEQNQGYSEFWNDSAGSTLPVTDAAGRWQVKDFPTDLPNVAIEFIRTDGSVEKFRYPPVAVNMNEPQGDPLDLAALLSGNARFVLKSGYVLHGLVVDFQDRPLPGVLIKTGYGMVNLEHAGEVRSDEAGHFVLQHLNHRQVILTADAAGCAITSLVVDLHSNLPEVRLQMGELSPLSIHVEDGDGKAIADAKVSSEFHGTEGQLLDFAGTTDPQGNLTWTNAPVSTFSLAAVSPTSALRQQIHLTPNQREVTFRLRAGMDKGIIVNARVNDAKTGAPVKLESVKYQTADREGFKWDTEVSGSGFHLALPATQFRPGMYPTFQLQLKAEGYATLATPWRDFDEGDWDASFVMEPAGTAGGTVMLPDGSPAAGARLWTRAEDTDGTLFINRPDAYYGDRMVKAQADANGKFILPDVPDDQPVIFTITNGFLSTSAGEVKRNPNVRLQPWGRVAGVLKIAGKPRGGVSINLAMLQWFPKVGFNLIYSTSTAPDGSFAFEHVPAGEYKLYRYVPRNGQIITEDHPLPLVVKAGETVKIEYSNPGRAVIGHAMPDKPELSVDWLNNDDTLILKQPPLGTISVNPKDYATEKAFQAAYNDSYQSPERLEQAREARTYLLAFDQDGSFRADDIPPGTYELKIQVTKPDPNNRDNPFRQPENELGSITREIVVPPGDTPFDLGTLVVPMKDDGKRATAVDFAAQTLDGKPVSLAQFKGKYVLLAFWALWSERSTEHLVDFQKLQTELSHDNRVAFLGASLDNDAGAVRKAVEARGYQWTQTWLNSTNLANRPLKYGRVFSGAIFHG